MLSGIVRKLHFIRVWLRFLAQVVLILSKFNICLWRCKIFILSYFTSVIYLIEPGQKMDDTDLCTISACKKSRVYVKIDTVKYEQINEIGSLVTWLITFDRSGLSKNLILFFWRIERVESRVLLEQRHAAT